MILDKLEGCPVGLAATIIYLSELLEIASDEHTRMRALNGFPPLNDIGRWEQMHSMLKLAKNQEKRRHD